MTDTSAAPSLHHHETDTAQESQFNAPRGIALNVSEGCDRSGSPVMQLSKWIAGPRDLYIADSAGFSLRRLAQNEVTHVLGDGAPPPPDEYGAVGAGADARLYNPQGIRMSLDGASLLICDGAPASRVLRMGM